MSIEDIPKKYDLKEGLFRTTKSENEFISKLKLIDKKIYLFLKDVIIVGIFVWILMLILFIFMKNNLIINFFIIVSVTNILLSIIRQIMRKYIKKKIKNNKYYKARP